MSVVYVVLLSWTLLHVTGISTFVINNKQNVSHVEIIRSNADLNRIED